MQSFSATTGFGILFWMPLLLSQIMPKAPAWRIALLSAVPYSIGSIAMLLNAHSSRRLGERRWHTAIPLALSGVCLTVAPHVARASSVVALLVLSGATAGQMMASFFFSIFRCMATANAADPC